MSKIYTLSGKPIPLARPRLGKTHTYDSQAKLKEASSWEIMAQRPKPFLLTKRPLQMVVTFNMGMPKAWSRIKQDHFVSKPCLTRPDVDNLLKYLLDVCNGLLFEDDSQVTSVHAKKIYSFVPSTTFQLIEIL